MDICVDFDGTCVTHEFPRVGKVIGSEPILRKLVNNGHNLILFTMRSGESLDSAIEWFKSRQIPLFGIQSNPSQKDWTTSPKAYGQLYIDDAALGCPLTINKDYSDRPFVDWEKVDAILKEKGLF